MCLYKGNYICKDLKNGEEYSFAHSTQQIKKELSEIKSGDIVSVCRYQGFDFFIASYQCTYPAIKKFEKTQDIILKQGTSYKWATAQIGKSYRVSSLIGYNQRAERYPLLDRSFSMDICEEAIAVYGYANAFLYEGERVVVFTNIANGKMYSVPMDTVKEADFKALCEDTYFFKAHLTTDGSCLAYLAKGYPTEKLETLEYLYEDDGKACCMDAYTYELYEIPLRDLPKGTKENEMLSGYTAQHDELKAVNTEGRIFVLHKL
jgi:translation elongation factor P/translation initiation factor 5A